MANPTTPVYASPVIPPPVLNLPFVQPDSNGQFLLTPSAIEFLQTLWASIAGTGGLIDIVNLDVTNSGIVQGLALALIDEVAARLILQVPPANPAASQQADAALLPSSPLIAAVLKLVEDTALFHLPVNPAAPKMAEDIALLLARPVVPPAPMVAVPFAQLPTAPEDGTRGFITDSSVVAAGNFGAVAAGGGTDHVPTYYDAGTSAWLIG